MKQGTYLSPIFHLHFKTKNTCVSKKNLRIPWAESVLYICTYVHIGISYSFPVEARRDAFPATSARCVQTANKGARVFQIVFSWITFCTRVYELVEVDG